MIRCQRSHVIREGEPESTAERVGLQRVELRDDSGHRLLADGHIAPRRYFIMRNRIRVWLEYAAAEPRYVLGDVVSCMKELVKLFLFEEERGHKLRSIVLGAREGLRGRLGADVRAPSLKRP